jgi:hypothetical protein
MNEKITEPLSQTSKADHQGFHVDPVAYNIVKIELYPHNATLKEKEGDKTFLDLRPQVNMILITESIFQSALHVSFGIIDAVGILDELRIQGGEKIHLRIEQKIKQTVFSSSFLQDLTKDIDLELYISDIKNFEKPKIDTQTYTLECVTKPAFLNQLKVLNDPFNDTPAELIKKIAEGDLEIKPGEKGRKFKPNSIDLIKAIDDTVFSLSPDDSGYGESIKGIYPKLRPMAAINWLLRNSNDNGAPIFFYESMTYGYQLKSWEDMHDPADNFPYMGMPFTNFPLDSFFKGREMTIDNPEYYDYQRRKIISLQSSLGVSKYNDARKGAYASNLTSVDFSTKIYKSGINWGSVFKYDNDDKMEKLNRYKPFSDKIKFNGDSLNTDSNKDARNFFVSLNLNAFKDWKNYHSALKVKDIQKKESYRANMDVLTHTMEIPGDPVLGAGMIVQLYVHKIQDQNLTDEEITTKATDGDTLMGGRFIIKKINHYFKSTGYTMDCEIIKDSSTVDLDEEIKV